MDDLKPVFLLIIGVAAMFAGCKSQPASLESAETVPFLVYPVEKIRPEDRPPSSRKTEIRMAGNEYETVLIGIYNPNSSQTVVSDIGFEITGSDRFQLHVFHVEYMDISRSSRWFHNTKGRWPDPLIPLPAVTAQQQSNSNTEINIDIEEPVIIPSGENRIFLLEVFLPPDTGAAPATITARFSTGHNESEELYITIIPYAFDLPRIPSFATAFGMSRARITDKHEELSEQSFDPTELHLAYLRCMAEHRISVFSPFSNRIQRLQADNGELEFDWNDFDRLTGGMLDGTLFPEYPPATSARIPRPPDNLNRDQVIRFYREFAFRARQNGWLDRMFYYLPDEPMRREYPQVREIASFIKEADSGILTLATEPFTKQLQGHVDIWCPDIPVIGDSVPFLPLAFKSPKSVCLDWQRNPRPNRYQNRQREGETAWFYTCMSAQFLDYPNLFTDSKAAYHRVIPWLAFRYGFSGLLYYNVVYSYRDGADPWLSQYQFMSNGDGNLVYPGFPGLPNISTHKPIPSLRLKLLREGLEDYEYLLLYERISDRPRAIEMAANVARKSLRWEHDISSIANIRNLIATAIEAE